MIETWNSRCCALVIPIFFSKLSCNHKRFKFTRIRSVKVHANLVPRVFLPGRRGTLGTRLGSSSLVIKALLTRGFLAASLLVTALLRVVRPSAAPDFSRKWVAREPLVPRIEGLLIYLLCLTRCFDMSHPQPVVAIVKLFVFYFIIVLKCVIFAPSHL